MKKKFYLVSLISLFTISNTFAQPGSLDLAFDGDGSVIADLGDDYANSMTLQSDGKIILAGYSYNGSDNDFSLARFNTDGSFDTSFDTDGLLVADFGGYEQFATGVAMQSDGKIVVSGTTFNGLNNDIMIMRFNSDGSLDTGFDGDGIKIIDVGLSVDYGRDIAVQADGNIIVVGSTDYNTTIDFVIVRVTTTGALDNTFDTDGIVMTDINNGDDHAKSVVIQPDGHIIAAGYGYIGIDADFVAARYTATGALDIFFNGDGKLFAGDGAMDDIGNCVALHTDGTFVISGYVNNGIDNDYEVAKFTSAGNLDVTFDTDGLLTTNLDGFEDQSFGCAIQTNGKIIVAGASSNGTNTGFGIVCYNPNGSLDNNFDGDGKVTTLVMNDTYAQTVAIQTDGKIVAGGYGYGFVNADFVGVRYIGECNVDTGTNQSGAILSADASLATYQWVDCDNSYAIIPGANAQIFTATSNGNYAVIVSQAGCSDTSACLTVSGLGYIENTSSKISVYPNPTNGELTIYFDQPLNNVSIKLINVTGEVLFTENNFSGTSFSFDLSENPSGIYFVELNNGIEIQRIKVIKQ